MARSSKAQARSSQVPAANPYAVDQLLSKAQFVVLLLATFLVPLIVLPESNFVDITSTPKTTILRMLGTFQLGILAARLAIWASSSSDERLKLFRESVWRNSAAKWLVYSLIAVTLVSIISALLSIMPAQSWWGRTPAGFEAGEFSALMYITLAISAIVSLQDPTKLRQFLLVFSTTSVVAALIGVAQWTGFSLFDISSTHLTRITGTNGNPIFYAAMLVMMAPVTFAFLLSEYERSGKADKNYWLGALGIAGLAFGISFIATVSRGAWVGAAVAGLLTTLLILTVKHPTPQMRPAIALIVPLAIGALLALGLDPDPTVNAETGEELQSEFQSVGGTSTLDLRFRYWSLATEAAIDRENVPFTNDAPKFVRWFFGYGPDMFRYAGSYLSDSSTFTRRLTAAHNDPINRLFEQGLLGFSAWMVLWGSIVAGLVHLLKSAHNSEDSITAWLSIGLSAAFTARFIEQLFGSPTPGGVIVFWLLVGVLVVAVLPKSKFPVTERLAAREFRIPSALTLSLVGIILIGSIAIAWEKGASYLIANNIASFQYRTSELTYENANKRLEQAASFAPDHQRYWHDLSSLENNRANAVANPATRLEVLEKAYEYDLRAFEANPMEVNGLYRLAFSAWEAGGAGSPGLRQETVQIYERLVEIFPSDNLAKERLELLQNALSGS